VLDKVLDNFSTHPTQLIFTLDGEGLYLDYPFVVMALESAATQDLLASYNNNAIEAFI